MWFLCSKLSNGLPAQDKVQSVHYDLMVWHVMARARPYPLLAVFSLLQPQWPSCCFASPRTSEFVCQGFSANSSLVIILLVILSGHWSWSFNTLPKHFIAPSLLYVFFLLSTYHYFTMYFTYSSYWLLNSLTGILISWNIVQRIQTFNHTQILSENRIKRKSSLTHFTRTEQPYNNKAQQRMLEERKKYK